jgi:DNA-binding IclR family transcriptional regulator
MARPALAATRAIGIINFCATHPTASFTLSDFVDRLDINVASLHAILAVLTKSGYLSRHPRHRTYILGPALVAVGTAALEPHAAIKVAREETDRLSDRLDLDVAVTALAGDDVVFVARSGTNYPRGFPSHVGMRMPLRPPMGSIFYAWADTAAVDTWLRLGETRTDAESKNDRRILAVESKRGYSVALEVDLRRELGAALEQLAEHPKRETRGAVNEIIAEFGQQGNYLETIDPSARYDVSSISGPVFDTNTQVVLAVTLIGFPSSISGAEAIDYGNEVLSSGLVISRRTRGVPPANLLARTPAGAC